MNKTRRRIKRARKKIVKCETCEKPMFFRENDLFKDCYYFRCSDIRRCDSFTYIEKSKFKKLK